MTKICVYFWKNCRQEAEILGFRGDKYLQNRSRAGDLDVSSGMSKIINSLSTSLDEEKT
jgi:hypothetical protein